MQSSSRQSFDYRHHRRRHQQQYEATPRSQSRPSLSSGVGAAGSGGEGVFRFYDLPRELQLLIIETCLPPVNDVSRDWPPPIPALLRTSRQFKTDTQSAMQKWSPVHYVPNTQYLHSLPLSGGVVKVEDICLSMFHDARVDVLMSSTLPWARPYDHRGLVMVWTSLVGFLPRVDSIRSVAIDATPVPGWLRYDRPAWVPRLVAERAVADRFIYEHVAVVADLILAVKNFYASFDHPINVELVGQYGDRSQTFPSSVLQRCRSMNVSVPFTGEILPPLYDNHDLDVTSIITIKRAIMELYSAATTPVTISSSSHSRSNSEFQHGEPQLNASTATSRAQLRHLIQDYGYSPTSDFFFRNLFIDDQYDTMRLLERLTDYALLDYEADGDKQKPRYIDVQTSGFARGSFICSLARDLDLQTSSRGNWQREEIRLIKRDAHLRQQRQQEQSQHQWGNAMPPGVRGPAMAHAVTNSVLNFLVNSAIVVFFALDAIGF